MNPAPSLKAVASLAPEPRAEDSVVSETASWAEPRPGYLEQDAMRFFYRWGGHLSATMIRIRSKFDGDLDQYLLYLIFLLAEITQIPRETTRRKLLALVERGYLVREDDGLFTLGEGYDVDQCFTDLKPLFWDAVQAER